jgi:membrane associated rhomboid family serine protease
MEKIYNSFRIWLKGKSHRRYPNSLVTLAILNFVVFFGLWVVELTPFYETVSSSFIGHNTFNTDLAKPWTVLTYSISHKYLIHFAMNMIGFLLYFKPLSMIFTDRQIWFLYIMGALFGVVGIYLYNCYYDPTPRYYIGASASLYALITCVYINSMNSDYYLIFGKFISGKVFLICIVLIEIIMCVLNINGGGSASHLGGMSVAAVFMYMRRRSIDISSVFEPIYILSRFLKKAKRTTIANF